MTEESDKKNIYKTILSLDGGGIRGIITAKILQEIEKKTGKRIHELFDLIVGTSAGGILAAGLAGQPPKNHAEEEVPPYTAKEMVGFYRAEGPKIFDRTPFNSWYWSPKYPSKPLEKVLEELLGDAELKGTKPDIIATSYDIEAREPYLFKTSKARSKECRNHLLRHVARATSAAPSYFKPLLLDNKQWDKEKKRRVLVDGGVFENNPSMIAFSEALSSGAKMEEILLCAVGTGTNNRPLPYKKAKGWGLLEWGQDGRMISVMMDGMSDSADYHALRLLPGSESDDKQKSEQRFFRFNIELEHASDDLDDASNTNIKNLLKKAEEILKNQETELKQLAKALKDRQPRDQGTGGQGTSTES